MMLMLCLMLSLMLSLMPAVISKLMARKESCRLCMTLGGFTNLAGVPKATEVLSASLVQIISRNTRKPSVKKAPVELKAMRVVLLRRKDEILATIAKKAQRDKASELLSVAETDLFWHGLQQMVQNMLPIRVALRSVESDSARLDQVLEQYGSLANHFSYSESMTAALEKRWSKMDQGLFLLAYTLHPARQMQHINQKLAFAFTNNIAQYATELYQRFFGGTEEEGNSVFTQVAEYLAWPVCQQPP